MLVTASSTTDTSSIVATYSLAKGGDDEYNGRQVVCRTPAGSIATGELSWVSDFGSSTSDATVAPVFSAAVTDGDVFEMWRSLTYEEVNDAINQSIIEVTPFALTNRVTDGNFTFRDRLIYDWLVPYAFGNDFRSLNKVEYAYNVGVSKAIHNCEVAWDELVDGDVTAVVDTTYSIEGKYALKLTVAAGASAGDILATDGIASLDISGCDTVELFIRSTVALDAGDIQILLDDTASCGSPLETLDIPATLVNTDTYHTITLDNPQLDTAIISIGAKMVQDKGAVTIYIDRVRAVDSNSKEYRTLPPDMWSVVKGVTPKLALTNTGIDFVGNGTEMRLTGLSAPDIMSDETTDAEIDPAYIIAKTTGHLLIAHAKSSRLDIKDREGRSEYWLGVADKIKPSLMRTPNPTTRWT